MSSKALNGMVNPAPRHYPMSERTLVTQEQIWEKTAACARQIAADYKGKNLSVENPLVLVCVLKGSFLFTADLCRFLADEGIPVHLEFICVSSYGKGTETSGEVRMLLDVRETVEGKHVILVEDIVDSAVTLKYLLAMFNARNPASLKTIVLLDKPSGRKTPLSVDYPIITVPGAFVIGYGMDCAEAYRELRDVCILKRSYYEKPESKL